MFVDSQSAKQRIKPQWLRNFHHITDTIEHIRNIPFRWLFTVENTNPILQCNLKMFLLRYSSQNRSKSSSGNSCCLPTSSLHHQRLNNACRFIIASHHPPHRSSTYTLCTYTTPFNSPHWIVELCDCVKMMRFGFVVYLISLAGPFRYNEGFCYKATTSCALRCEVRNLVCVLWVGMYII